MLKMKTVCLLIQTTLAGIMKFGRPGVLKKKILLGNLNKISLGTLSLTLLFVLFYPIYAYYQSEIRGGLRVRDNVPKTGFFKNSSLMR